MTISRQKSDQKEGHQFASAPSVISEPGDGVWLGDLGHGVQEKDNTGVLTPVQIFMSQVALLINSESDQEVKAEEVGEDPDEVAEGQELDVEVLGGPRTS